MPSRLVSLSLDMPVRVLAETIRDMLPAGRGLLAADESVKSVGKRLDPIGLESTDENRRRFRELFLAAHGAENYLSGVILVEETLRQASSEGVPFPKLVSDRGIVPGIKVDLGTKDLPGFPDEVVTEGIDGLADRLAAYRELGARFAKWRAVIRIGDELPTESCVELNACLLAYYAMRCIEAGIVPMVEPEVLLDGVHSLERAEAVTERVLKTVIEFLGHYRIDLGNVVVKTSMVLPGKDSGQPIIPEQIAEATVRCLRASIPHAVGGVVFLSGGQSSEQATVNLNAIAKHGPFPWPLTFCFARALQYPATDIWAGKDENLEKARAAFLDRLKANAAASTGNF
jgi:fructose-bisphosphate aldolase, class I